MRDQRAVAAEEQQLRERREREAAAARRKENSSANASSEVKQKLQVSYTSYNYTCGKIKYPIRIVTEIVLSVNSLSRQNFFNQMFNRHIASLLMYFWMRNFCSNNSFSPTIITIDRDIFFACGVAAYTERSLIDILFNFCFRSYF